MTKSRIIGHRGAAGLALENTLPGFRKAIEVGVQVIEFDVHTTLDNQLVVCHDSSLERVSTSNQRIKDLTLSELQAIKLHNGSYVPTLIEVLDLAHEHHLAVIVEVKAVDDYAAFCRTIDNYSGLDVTIASFNHGAVAAIKQLRPAYRAYLAEAHQAVATLHKAKTMGMQGIDLHYMLMNPLTYLLARVWKLDIMLYTVNNPTIARFLLFLYPKVSICTNYPNLFIHKERQA